jgi:hypothetical protein
MKNLKKFRFDILTVEFENDKDSPHVIASFEFQAESRDLALKYMDSLRSHFKDNKPYSSLSYPLSSTQENDLKEIID